MQTFTENVEQLETALAKSNVTEWLAQRWTVHIFTEYAQSSQKVPYGEAWRYGKLEDAAGDARRVDGFHARFGLSKSATAVLIMIAVVADIGRLIVRRERNGYRHPEDQACHGAVSAEYLRSITTAHVQGDQFFQSLLRAVTHHSDRTNPSLADLDQDELTWVLCRLLRDIDMSGNWLNSGVRYLDPDKMQREIKANALSDGLGRYVPETLIEQFEAKQPLDRRDCPTYAAYMLQFLAWGYNFTFQEFWQEVLESGQPQAVLAWVLANIDDESHRRRIGLAAHKNLSLVPAE